MSQLVADCPRCGSNQMTFDLLDDHLISIEHNWKGYFEAFCVCRHCNRATIFVLSQKDYETGRLLQQTGLTDVKVSVNQLVAVESFVSIKNEATVAPPEYLPPEIGAAFREGATCLAVECYNAAATMFRLCIDLCTRSMLPEQEVQGLNYKMRRDLGLRLPWLFDNGYLPGDLRELSSSVKEDGNDGAHAGTLEEEDADDLLDFTKALLERIYTEPERVKQAKERRLKRRAPPAQ